MNNQMDPNANYNQQPMMQPQQPIMLDAQPLQVGQKTNTMCILALLFAFLVPIVGLILGIIGIGNSKKKGEKGKGMAIAAIIISLLMPVIVVVLIFGVLYGAINGTSESATALQEGCKSLDAYGNYESDDGFVICENYYCEYEKDGFSLSSSCDFVNYE